MSINQKDGYPIIHVSICEYRKIYLYPISTTHKVLIDITTDTYKVGGISFAYDANKWRYAEVIPRNKKSLVII